MPKTIDYFLTPVSPWTYLGHDRLVAIAARHGAAIAPKLVDFGRVFPISGGLPLAKRAPQRQAYRLMELARWRDHLGIPINFQPKFGAASGEPGTKWILAAREHGAKPALDLAGAIMRARWADERDIADEATLAARAATPGIAAAYEADTQEAMDRQVFGAPTYVYRDELFWGQDRLDFLDRALAQ